jgi:transaldolase
MFDFFFDTANIDYIKKAWASISPHCNPTHIRGITTNPNAMHKERLTSLKSWEGRLPELCSLVSTLRGDNKGVVYVQMPNCDMSGDDAIEWAQHISKFTDGNTKLGLKIPPYYEILKKVDVLNKIMETNVTGVADAATALSCFSFDPRYVSIIPGRMEEVGINAKEHLLFAQQRENHATSEIISGSMRTVDGLKMTVETGTVPTIGSRVWDQLIDPEFNLEEFMNTVWNTHDPNTSEASLNVLIDERNHKLSKDFFKQMNDLGSQVYKDWL